MATVTNLNNTTLDEKIQGSIDGTIVTLEEMLRPVLVNLTPVERLKYGSINEQNKLFVNTVYDYHRKEPALQSPDVDWGEFENDYAMRSFFEGIIRRMTRIITGLENAKIMHDYDNFQDALSDYSFATYKAKTSDPNFEDKYKNLKKFFNKTKKIAAQPAETTGDTPETNKD